MKKPLPDRIATLKARKEQMAAQLARLEARAKQDNRKRDTRRKIVVGAAVLSELERTPEFARFVRAMLNKAVTRPQDREAISDLLPASDPANTAAATVSNDHAPADRMAG